MPENPRIEELRRRVQADPASIAFAALAEEFRRTGRFEEAIETCRTGLQRHPAYLSARVTLGRALLETGDYGAAREELETVLRSAPENLAAIRGLEQIDERLGHSTEMHPDLHEIAREPIRLAAERPVVPLPPPVSPSSLELNLGRQPEAPRADLNLGAGDLSLSISEMPMASGTEGPATAEEHPEDGEPFDIFAAALQTPPAPPVPVIAFETSTIAFEAPAFASAPADASADTPAFPSAALDASAGEPPFAPATMLDPHLAATLTRLERFLGAIETARHA